MEIPDQAPWPPDIETVHEALASINHAYHANHRGGEIGNYIYEATGDTSGKMVCTNPYPSYFDYGLIYRIVQKFRDETSSKLLVRLDEGQATRKDGGSSCTYLIEW